MQLYDITKKNFSKPTDSSHLKKDNLSSLCLPSDIADIGSSVDLNSLKTVLDSSKLDKPPSSKFQRIKRYLSNFWTEFLEKDIKSYNDPLLDVPDKKIKYLDEPKNFKYALMGIIGGAGLGPIINLVIKKAKNLFSGKETIPEQPENKEEKSHALKNFLTATKDQLKEMFSLQPNSPDDKDSKIKRLGKRLLSYCEPRTNTSQGDNFKKANYLSGIITAMLSGGGYSRLIPGVTGVLPGIASILPGMAVAVAGALVGITVEKKTKSFYKGVAAAIISGSVFGSATGALIGGPIGAALGGLLGAITSALGTMDSNRFASVRDGNNDGYFIGLPFRLLTAGNPFDDLGAALSGSLGGRALKTKKGKLFLGAISGILVGLGIALVCPHGSILGSITRCAISGSAGSVLAIMRTQAQRNLSNDLNEKIESLNNKQLKSPNQ